MTSPSEARVQQGAFLLGGTEIGGDDEERRKTMIAVEKERPAKSIICVGDLHGQIDKMLALWANLEARLGKDRFLRCKVIFLGDYCDRNPHVKELLDWLIALPSRYPDQSHVYLMGNHDFAMAGLLGLLPRPKRKGSNTEGVNNTVISFSDTWRDHAHSEAKEGWWSGEGVEDVHLQGRRWGGVMKNRYNPKGGEYMGSIYDSAPTFASYGVEHGDREAFINAVPESHKRFLSNLLWVHEEEGIITGDAATSFKKLIAVHAGLDKNKPVSDQLRLLRAKDCSISRVEQLSGRASVWETPEQLIKEGALLLSGHHCRVYVGRHRAVIDESGGRRHLPLAALVLPERVIVRDRDVDRVMEVLPKDKQAPLSSLRGGGGGGGGGGVQTEKSSSAGKSIVVSGLQQPNQQQSGLAHVADGSSRIEGSPSHSMLSGVVEKLCALDSHSSCHVSSEETNTSDPGQLESQLTEKLVLS